jgi:serine phosphatase RsbU (regulator of sigma subunit)
MKAIISLAIIIFPICSPIVLFGQNKKVDSLRIVLKKANHDTTRLSILNEMAKAENDEKLSAKYDEQIEVIANKNLATNPPFLLKNTYKKFLSTVFHRKGLAYDYQDSISEALKYYNKSLNISEEIGDKRAMSKSLNNIGIIYKNQGDIPKALEYYNKCLEITEKLGDKRIIAICLTNIGIIYYNQDDISKALEYYNKGLNYFEELGDKSGISYSFHNIGIIYAKQGNFSKALEYNNKCIKICEELDDKSSISKALGNIGNIYLEQGDISKALEYYNKSLLIKEELEDKSGISNSLINIGSIYLKRNENLKAIDCAKRAYSLAKETSNVERISEAAKLLEEIYAKQGNFKLSRQYFGEYITMRDSITKEENQKLAQKKYFQYQYEKKAATDSIAHNKAIEIKNLEIGRQKVENRKQQIIIFSAVGGFLIVFVFSIIILRMFRQKRKANILLATQNSEILQQKEEISAQRDEISAQRDTVVIQKDHIEEQKKEITDSINYAKRIQQAVLPSGEYANSILGEHFILFKPKDIVSGDFYWGTRINEWLIVTVADCTGHGVPGAFMSMLGVSFLNEIVRKKEITKASEVLDHLRESIIEALQQKGTSGEQKDGMDIALCVLNTANYQLQFAGANNPLIIVSTKRELNEIEPDKQPVAIYENMKPYKNNVINIQKGDTLYLTSDGYEDQFGGPRNKKFMAKQLKELFMIIANKSMNEQQEILNNTFENWKGEHEQIDDVTILGLRI